MKTRLNRDILSIMNEIEYLKAKVEILTEEKWLIRRTLADAGFIFCEQATIPAHFVKVEKESDKC